MTPCAIATVVAYDGGVEWTLDGMSLDDTESKRTVIDEHPTVWLPADSSIAAVGGGGEGQALLQTERGAVPDVRLVAISRPSDCCGSRIAMVARGDQAGSAGYLHYGCEPLDLSALRSAATPPTRLAKGEKAGEFTVSPLVAAGVLLEAGLGTVLWVGVDGHARGWEPTVLVPPPGGRRVAERFADRDGSLVLETFLGLPDGRFVGFSPTPRGVGAVMRSGAVGVRV